MKFTVHTLLYSCTSQLLCASFLFLFFRRVPASAPSARTFSLERPPYPRLLRAAPSASLIGRVAAAAPCPAAPAHRALPHRAPPRSARPPALPSRPEAEGIRRPKGRPTRCSALGPSVSWRPE